MVVEDKEDRGEKEIKGGGEMKRANINLDYFKERRDLVTYDQQRGIIAMDLEAVAKAIKELVDAVRAHRAKRVGLFSEEDGSLYVEGDDILVDRLVPEKLAKEEKKHGKNHSWKNKSSILSDISRPMSTQYGKYHGNRGSGG
jgi:hypothetical protein